MFEMLRVFFLLKTGKETFLSIMQSEFPVSSSGYQLIVATHALVEEAFAHIRRNTGVLYLRHLEVVAVICLLLMRRLGVVDVRVVVAALLHDIIEDIKGWTRERVAIEFDEFVAMLVWNVSEEDHLRYEGKEIRNVLHQTKLAWAPLFAVLIKLSDVFHNLTTLWAMHPERQWPKIRLAWKLYIPLAWKNKILVPELCLALVFAVVILIVRTVTWSWRDAYAK